MQWISLLLGQTAERGGVLAVNCVTNVIDLALNMEIYDSSIEAFYINNMT